MLREAGYPVGVACTVLALSHSSYYYHPEKKDERELEEAIEEIAGEFPKYGTRRVSQQLRRSPHKLSVGRKRGRRFMAQKNLLRPVKRSKKGTTNSEHPYPRYPNLVKNLELTHPDQGVQYATYAYTDLLKAHNVSISMAAVGKAEENGYAERLMPTIKEEEVDLSEYLDFQDARNQIGRFIEDVYMTKRIHSSLGYLTPVEFENDWQSSQLAEVSP